MRYNKRILSISILLVIFVYVSVLYGQEKLKHNYHPSAGYVPNEETATQIAVAVWIPIYGKETIMNEKPFKVKLISGVWHISGSLPKGMLGGVAEAEIAKDDGRIIRISHSQ